MVLSVIFSLYLVVINVAAFFTMGTDKRRAVRKEWRISEKTLFLLASVGGGIGVYAGMFYFRHKTKRRSFLIGVPILTVLSLVLIIGLWIYLLPVG